MARKRVFRGERLLLLRNERGMTQDELNAALNFGQSRQVNKYETGKSDPSPEIIVRIATYFGVSVDWLLGLAEERNGFMEPAKISEKVMKYESAIDSGDFLKVIEMATNELKNN